MAKKRPIKKRLPPPPQWFSPPEKYKIFKPENTKHTIVRLEGFRPLYRPKTKPLENYKNRNISIDSQIKKLYNPFNLNFRTKKDVCRDRENRKRNIMRITKGAGLRVHYARWTPDSFSFCVR